MKILNWISRSTTKVLATGAMLVAAALPLAAAGTAGAATSPPDLSGASIAFAPHGTATNSFGTGAAGTFDLTSVVGAANDGGNVSLTTSAPGVTFTSVAEISATEVTGHFASTAATVAGSYSLTLTDNNGTSAVLAGAVTVNAAPALTTVAPATITAGNAAVTLTLTGTGFVTGATATLTNTGNGTTLASTATTGAFTAGVVTTGTQGATTFGSATSLTLLVNPTNSITGNPDTGTFTVTVTNPDGGTVTGGSFTVTPYGITNVSPSALPFAATSTNYTVTINGSGFQFGAAVTFNPACTGVTIGTTSVTSATTISVVIADARASGAGLCSVTVTNPDSAHGGNGASFGLTGALGIGEASSVAPTITASAVSSNAAIVPGATAVLLTVTGTGLSQYDTTVLPFIGTTTNAATGVTINGCAGNSGTSLTCSIAAGTGVTAGADSITVSGSDAFPNAFSVAGPVITAMAPAAIAVGVPIGTVVTLTGTGFNNTSTLVFTGNAGGLTGVLSYVSATSETFVVTQTPNAADTAALTAPTVAISETVSAGVTVLSAPFTIAVDAAPVVTSAVTYATAPLSGVGVGATKQQVVFHGTGFAAGATVTAFVNGAGVADANVTATVVSVTGSAITATIAIAAGDTNFADGYTVTNTDGGIYKVAAIAYPLLINAGPTITSVAPATAIFSATNAFTITGTHFGTGATVVATSNGTCGTPTITGTTSIAVSCTIGAPGATAVSLVVTNLDGGSATSAVVLPAATPVVKAGLHASAVHGVALTGHTVTVVVIGTGFYGQPKITSNAKGTKAVVFKDFGTVLHVHVTATSKSGKGWHTFTIRLANGKTCKVNYRQA